MVSGYSNQDSRLSPVIRGDAVATRARIVAAAEQLFAERGVDGTSLADINKAAAQRNRSAVQYHFGSKEGVIHAVLDKHTPGIEQRRHAMLDELEAEGDPELRSLVRALIIPVAEKLDDPDGGVAFLQLNAQLIGHPRFALLELHASRVNRGADRLQRLLTRAAPNCPESLWVSRFLLLIGVLFHGIADYAHLTRSAGAGLDLPSRQLFVSNLVDTAVAMLGAPVSPATRIVLPE